MPKLPLLTGPELRSILLKVGFVDDRQKGPHLRMRRERDDKVVTIPMHPGRDLDRGLLRDIIKEDLEWTRDYFMKVYNKYR
jgi:predicted RNA binding protein YcfA (HicA-like mRNA interferase family)